MAGTALRKHQSPHGRVTAVSMMKDEAPYLIEWVAHHLAVGFTDILVYTNDCSDGTDDMLIRLEELGLAHHRRNVIPEGIKPQPSAIKHAQAEPLVRESDWVLLFDADEFLCINYGDGQIDSLISAAGEAHGIVITWRIFGSGGVVDWSRDPVTEQYTRAAPPDWNKGWGVKTLFRFDHERWKLGIHRPTMKRKVLETDYPDSIRWLNGSGLPMEDYFKFRGWRSIRRTVGYDWAQMNHYAVKSVDAYALRKLRGNVNLKTDKYNADYWALQDRNEVEDTAILRYREKRAAIAAELLRDPVLSKLHEAALARAEARLAEFRRTPEYKELKAGLLEAGKMPIEKVDARPPKARDPEKIAALMSDVEKRANARAKPGRKDAPMAESFQPAPIDRTSALKVAEVENHGLRLPADPRIFVPQALGDVEKGKFRRRDARHRAGLLDNDDRLLELGGGIGFLALLACLEHPGLSVLMQEEREDLREIAGGLAEGHGIGAERFATASGAGGLAPLIAKFEPTVVACNDPGHSPADLAGALSPCVRRVILTTPVPKTPGWEAALAEAGFAAPEAIGKSGGLVFDRGS